MNTKRQAFFNYFNSQRYLKDFSAEEKMRLYDQYHNSVGLTTDITDKITSSEAFDTYADKRIKDHSGFKIPIGSDAENTLEKLLKDKASDPDANEVKTILKDVLAPSDFYTHAQDNFKDSMNYFKKRINMVPELSVEQLRGQLVVINAQAKKAIETQQKNELIKLEKKLPELTENIAKISRLDKDDPKVIKKIGDDLKAELQKKHKAQLDAFDKTTANSVTVIDKASALEKEQYIFTAMMKKWLENLSEAQRDAMEKEIWRAWEENRNLGIPEEDASFDINNPDGSMSLSSFNPDDLEFAISATGYKSIHDKNTGLWTVTFPTPLFPPLARLFAFIYFNRAHEAHFLFQAQIKKASGADSIIRTIIGDTPEDVKSFARKAYRTALEAGFEPDKITLKDDTTADKKVIDPNTIFTPGELKLLHDNAKAKREKLAKFLETKQEPKAQPEEITRQLKEVNDNQRIEFNMAGKDKDEIKRAQEEFQNQEKADEAEMNRIQNS